MKIFCQNTMHGLVPIYPSDQDEKRKLKLGEVYECDIKNPRNYQFHKKFMALVNLGHQNTSLELPFDVYRKYVVMKAGFVKVYSTDRGNLYEPESISFGNMSEDKFQDVYSRVLDVIIDDLDTTAEDVQNMLIDFM